jgi:hypothetical protein
LPRREEAMAGAGERGKLGVSRRARRGKKGPPRGVEKSMLIFRKGVPCRKRLFVNRLFLVVATACGKLSRSSWKPSLEWALRVPPRPKYDKSNDG